MKSLSLIPFLNTRYKEVCAELGCVIQEVGGQEHRRSRLLLSESRVLYRVDTWPLAVDFLSTAR